MVNDELLNPNDIEDSSRFGAIKTALLVVLGLLLIGLIATGILYFTNEDVKSFVNSTAAKVGISTSEQSGVESDTRVKELASFYLAMDEQRASERLYSLKQEDSKLYERILSSMIAQNSAKSARIRDNIRLSEMEQDVLKREYELMISEQDQDLRTMASHYKGLGIKGATLAIERELSATMDFKTVAATLERVDAPTTAKILYHMNTAYSIELEYNFGTDYSKAVSKEMDKYIEQRRQSESLASIYEEMKPDLAAVELENQQNFNLDKAGLIFSRMNYMSAAQILSQFEDESYVARVIEKIKELEDLDIIFEGSFSKAVSESVRVLKQYNEDVNTLVTAYTRMAPADLADIIDNLTENPIAFKEYQIDDIRVFRITEKEMTIEVLKRMRPVLVGQVLSELRNSERVEKASLLSREIGIPEP